MRYSFILFFACLACLIGLASCSQEQGTVLMDDYLDRLSNVVNVERSDERNFYQLYLEQRTSFLLTGGSKRIGLIGIDESISLLDLLSLSSCGLQTLVAERNSILGKHARPSQHLLYELAFLEHSPACIEALEKEGGSELAKQLSRVTDQKTQALPKLIWQTLVYGEEASQFWRLPYDIGKYQDKDEIAVISSLNALRLSIDAWLKGDYSHGHEQLEGHLSILNQNDGGALLKSFLMYSLALDEANALLDEARLCNKQTPLFNALAAQNVVRKFFVGSVQVWASRLSQRYYELLPHYRAFEARLERVESLEYQAWRSRRDDFFESAIQSSKSHVQRLEVLLNGCSKN
jgi:hypothetical protein